MRITIDTKADSPEELKHILALLQSVVGGQAYTNYAPSPPQAVPQTYSPMSIFSDDPPVASQPAPSPPTAPATTPSHDMFSMFSGSSQSQAAPPASQVYSSADDLLNSSNGDEERLDDNDDAPPGDYRVIPY